MEKPRVLIGCPTYNGMRYCIERVLNRLRGLDYPNYDILVAENSEDDYFFEELKKEDKIILMKIEAKGKKPMAKLIMSRNKIIEYALENGYDYVLMSDSDIIPPKDVIEELVSCEKDIVSALYYNYYVSSGKTKVLPVGWIRITEEEFEEMKKQTKFPDSVKSHKDLRRHVTWDEARSNKLIEVLIPAAGCMLLSRKIFEKIRYNLLDMKKLKINAETSEDVYFSLKAEELGFKQYCYTKVKCDHLVSGKFKKDSDGILRHPLY